MDQLPPTPLGSQVASMQDLMVIMAQCVACKAGITNFTDQTNVIVRDDVWWKKGRSVTAIYACGCQQTYRFAMENNAEHPTVDQYGNEIDLE